MRSSSSVVTPGAMALPTSTSASAAMRPAMRIAAMVSASLRSGPSYGVGAGLPTYSGRAIDAGTSRMAETVPGARAARTPEDMC